MRSRNEIILPTAWTGIAGALMIGGQTCHSRFGIPVPFTQSSTSRINISSPEAEYIRKSKVIICDEASMIPSYFLKE